jgi:hypothetical protein
MRNEKGQFVKGVRSHPETEFKPGQHWRPRKPYWDREWLHEEYVVKQRSASEIAEQFGIRDTAIYFWLKKHDIATRPMSEIRAHKQWGVSGEQNGMYGKRGAETSNWKGGVTPERQAFYASRKWAQSCQQVWRRDGATCQRCGKHGSKATTLHVHHIISFAYKETRADADNLVLLCNKCHRFVHSRKNTQSEFIKEGGGTK